jgi:hypothetical protein
VLLRSSATSAEGVCCGGERVCGGLTAASLAAKVLLAGGEYVVPVVGERPEEDRVSEMNEFVAPVEKMRRLQRLYFRKGNPGVLAAAKEAEREVDRMLKRIESAQGRLF